MKVCMHFFFFFFSSFYEAVHVVWMYMLDYFFPTYFFPFFPHCEFSHFSPSIYRQWVPHFLSSIYRQWVPCEHNSSYTDPYNSSYTNLFGTLHIFLHSLKMCMCFSYTPCLIFCHLFVLFELCHLLISDNRQQEPCDNNFSYNFKPVF